MGAGAGWLAAGAGLLRRLLGRLRCAGTRALHVDAAAEVRAFGNRDARRGDVAVDRPLSRMSTFSRGGDVAGDLAEDDDRLGEHLGLDLAVRPDREHVLPELDLAFDLAFDRQVLAAVQLALDDDRFADVHCCPSPFLAGCVAGGHCGPRRLGGRRCGRRCWRRSPARPDPSASTASSRFHMWHSPRIRTG